MDLEALALAVDELVRNPACDRSGGRLYAVRCSPGAAGGDVVADHAGGAAGAVVLELLAEGEARTLPQRVRPPASVHAIALASGVWAAPLDDRPDRAPSLHPERRRAHVTFVVARVGDREAVDISVIRYGDGPPTVARNGMGLIHDRMIRCWSRRAGSANGRAA